ncbi:MAG: AAA family ATPase [Candidatus Altiarchaeia archaeon]
MKLVIGLTGNIGAGKTVVSDHLHKKYGADQVRFSRILMDVLDRLYLPKDRNNLQTLGEVVRKSFGSDVIVNAFKKDLEKSRSHVVVVDGIRYMNEVKMLRSFDNNVLLFMDAPPKVRYERVVMRGEKGEEKNSFDVFLKAEQRGTEKGLPEIKKVADYMIENDGSVERLLKNIDDIVKKRL